MDGWRLLDITSRLMAGIYTLLTGRWAYRTRRTDARRTTLESLARFEHEQERQVKLEHEDK